MSYDVNNSQNSSNIIPPQYNDVEMSLMNIKKKKESLAYRLKKREENMISLSEEQKIAYLKEIFFFYSK